MFITISVTQKSTDLDRTISILSEGKKKSHKSFKLFSQKLKVENTSLKNLSHAGGQKKWVKTSELQTKFLCLFEHINSLHNDHYW